jgi:hypothetical protein
VKWSYWLLAFMMALVGCMTTLAAPIPKEKEKEHEGTNVDSGTFGVYQKGHRVGTETFSIYQTPNGSTITSEFKTENAPTQDVQTSEMLLTSGGDIRRYEWKEVSPEKAQSVLLPNGEFLNQRWSGGADDKDHEQPYLLPPSTSILDDYFFIHREVLAWKFLGTACKQGDKGQLLCTPKHRTQLGTINPRQRTSASLTAEFIGRETITHKGAPVDLLRVELKNDAGTFELWLDEHDHFKVIRMSVVGENTEVERD